MLRVGSILPGLLAAAILGAATLFTSEPVLAQPGNDNFADRVTITALNFTDGLSTVDATSEPTEPRPCGDIGSTVWYEFTPSSTMTLLADTAGSSYDTVLAVYDSDPFLVASPVVCNDDSDGLLTSRVLFIATGGVTYYFQVGGFFDDQGQLVFHLGIPEGPPGDPACSDAIDNDFDGATDSADSGCQATEGPAVPDSCSDGVDNDGDGLVDSLDPACIPVPEGPPADPSCSDTIDNDFDGLVDGADSGCGTDEHPSVPNSCFDGVDNDGDGLVDLADPACVPSLEGPPEDLSCSDAIDNDFDGLLDDADSGCQTTEGPPFFASCEDTVDNDSDGLVDLADPDCVPPPEGPPGDPNCSDAIDNDFDGFVDGADSGCQTTEGPPFSPSCFDGVDNDGDGLLDEADQDCAPVPPPPPPPLPCTLNPIGGTPGWTSLAPLPLGREGSTGVVIGDRIYVTHGTGPPFGDDTTNFVYDRPTDTWFVGAAASQIRSELSGVCAEGADGVGRVHAIGGRFQDSVLSTNERYDPATNAWATVAPMPTARAGLCTVWVPSQNEVYAIGGRTGPAPSDGSPLAANERYDPVADTWVARAPMPVPMMDVYACVFHPGTSRIYVIGGFDGTGFRNDVQVYDPVADAWLTPGAPMPTARSNAIAGVCGGDIYVIGGYNGSNIVANERYDPVANSWSASTAKPTPASEIASTAISTGAEIFAIGSGIFGESHPFNQRFICEPAPTPCITDDVDFDNDGIRNRRDRDDDNDGVRDNRDRDDDNDGIRDRRDSDDDNDGIPDDDDDDDGELFCPDDDNDDDDDDD